MYDYANEKAALREFLAGNKKAAEIKGFFAPYGIYQQKNDQFMMRIRINGGRISQETLRKLIEIGKCSKAAYLHFTTRQDVQLHNVNPNRIEAVIDLCQELGLPFRGGGGDTFRNLLTAESAKIPLSMSSPTRKNSKNIFSPSNPHFICRAKSKSACTMRPKTNASPASRISDSSPSKKTA